MGIGIRLALISCFYFLLFTFFSLSIIQSPNNFNNYELLLFDSANLRPNFRQNSYQIYTVESAYGPPNGMVRHGQWSQHRHFLAPSIILCQILNNKHKKHTHTRIFFNIYFDKSNFKCVANFSYMHNEHMKYMYTNRQCMHTSQLC